MTAMQRAAGFQRWRELLFLHWAMPPGALRPLVPAALELDLFEGAAWVTLIPFEIVESRPRGIPGALAARFLEVNLRTYVRGPDGEPGIYFWSLEASSLLAVVGARLLYGLPYFPARMSMRRAGTRVEYTSRRRFGASAELRLGWTVAEAIGTARPGTLDHFLICDNRGVVALPEAGGLSAGRGIVIDRTGRSRVTRTVTGALADNVISWSGMAGVALTCP